MPYLILIALLSSTKVIGAIILQYIWRERTTPTALPRKYIDICRKVVCTFSLSNDKQID